jgi:ADP-heptose:LPS heptosyltransferase
MGERFRTRALVVPRALVRRLTRAAAGGEPRRVLVAHNLLLGDTLMLTPLLAKLRARHPQAEITLLAAPSAVPLYEKRPFGVRALPFRPADSATTEALLREEPFDLAFVVGDNRYSWLAAAMGARHVVAHAGDPRASSGWLVDEAHEYPAEPGAWSDLVAQLVDGPRPRPYARGDWPAPSARPFDAPTAPYAVLHVGGSTPLKHWPADRWSALAAGLAAHGYAIAWSAGPGEEALVRAADPENRHLSYAGRLDLAQVWQLVAGARVLVSLDTGVAHLGRVTWTPTVTLFGPGSAVLAGPGDFWRDTPWRAVGRDPFPCRDQPFVFRRRVEWVRRCGRTTAECPEPKCMQAIQVEEVLGASLASTS